MTTLNSLEILKKFFGNNSSSGIALEMVRNGLFEEQLKLASQWEQSSQEKPSKEDSLPMIKKTLPVGRLVPAQTPKLPEAARREETSPGDSTRPAANAASSPHSGALEESSSPSERPRVRPTDAPPPVQNQVPTSEESQPADENESPEFVNVVFSEDSSGAAGEEAWAGLPASALLREISPKEESKTEDTSDQDIQAVAAGEEAPLMVAPAQAPIPSSPAPPEDQSAAEQASPAPLGKASNHPSGTTPKSSVPGPLPADLLPRKETFSESQTVSHLVNSDSEQIGPSKAPGVEVRTNGSGQAIPPEMNPRLGTSQGIAVPTPAVTVSGGLSAERAASAGSGGASAGNTGSISGVGQPADRSGATSSAANPTKAQSTAGPEGAAQEAGVQRVRFVQRVARAFQALRDGGGTVRLRLHPPELGSLRVELTVREGVLHARMEVENSSARTAILEHLPMLRERLAQQDIRIEQFEVEIGGQSNGGLSQQSDNPAAEQRNASFSPPSNRSRSADANPATSRGNPLAASESTKLNVVI